MYLEKPVATTLPDARRVRAAWRAAGTVGMIGFAELLGERGLLVADRYAGTLELRPPLPPYSAIARARRGLRGLRRLPAEAATP